MAESYNTLEALGLLGAKTKGLVGAAISADKTVNWSRAGAGFNKIFSNIAPGSKVPFYGALAGGALVASNALSSARDRPISTGLAAGAGALTAMHYKKAGWKGAAVGAAAWAMFG